MSFPGKWCSRFNVNGVSEEAKAACNNGTNKKGVECVWLTNQDKCVSMKKAGKMCARMGMYLKGDTCQDINEYHAYDWNDPITYPVHESSTDNYYNYCKHGQQLDWCTVSDFKSVCKDECK